MDHLLRSGTTVLALLLLMFLGESARAMSLSCSGSLSFNNMFPGRSSVHSFSCSVSGTTGIITSYSTALYLAALPQAGANTLPASNIAASPSNGGFTSFTDVGSEVSWTPSSLSQQTIYVQVTSPIGQPSGQYSGMLTVQVEVDYTP